MSMPSAGKARLGGGPPPPFFSWAAAAGGPRGGGGVADADFSLVRGAEESSEGGVERHAIASRRRDAARNQRVAPDELGDEQGFRPRIEFVGRAHLLDAA